MLPSYSELVRASAPSPADRDGCALVEALGSGVIASNLGLTTACVSNWRKRGVPRAHRYLVAQLAERQGLAVPDGFLPTLGG